MDADGGKGAVLSVIRTVAETGSTNADLLALARAGAIEEGIWLRADRQTAGRGRQGRTWVSPPGNVYASTVVRLRSDDPSPSSLSFVAAVALAHVIDALGCPAVRIKWPNDLMVDSAKVAGILLERAENAVVIGFGVNLAFAPMVPERQTTSLLGRIFSVDADRFVEDLAGEVRLWLHKWRTEGLASVIERWEQMAHTRGAVLSVRLPNHEKVVGRFDGLDPDGALILRLADGARRAIHAGDVFWSDPHAARD